MMETPCFLCPKSSAMRPTIDCRIPKTLAALLTVSIGIGLSVMSIDTRAAALDAHSQATRDPKLSTALEDYAESNYPVALREFREEAQRGNRIAQFDYAMMLLNGEGTQPDLPQALQWLHKAADANMTHAQYIYAKIFDDGQMVPSDPTLAHQWFLRAAKHGHVGAEIALATQFMDGRGTARNYNAAFHWYLRAARQGDSTSQYIVASFYEKGGDGVKVDLVSAQLWYALASAQGDPAAIGKYAEVSERLKAEGHAHGAKGGIATAPHRTIPTPAPADPVPDSLPRSTAAPV
ncbi:tetratricopeptide repeat protein [Robbsia sp. KACC 23696]|uniref:tetratricopeptide repeat protein n=1 Tax=Robbsia sp. KACC 23696 TaxID=3149231 RepID=UPI00325C1ABC